ncbi:hypothetical protein Poly21_52550 [Allorhodopirellula heiligendammensis]|uniref:Uncharacterized protein n=1 Tax=Allorhodopirellula heiligendammensis TaxID=2714739 RepID=A0A5C6BE59_9BACT|nr:hypothetical protein Poly21_52550 [Allorhodopirellula heiligendammensis]
MATAEREFDRVRGGSEILAALECTAADKFFTLARKL